MAEELLYCAGCNANFKAKSYDPNKTYPCPKCKQPLKLKGEADASASGVALDTQGRAAQTDEGKDPLVGQKIAQYRIVRKLGQGGMGSVYEAKHLELGRTVALKILSPRLAAEEPDAVERFKREARAAAVLEHPNVVTTHAVGSEGDHHFIELQLIDGESLQARVLREKRLSLAEATRIIADSSKALGAAHKQNIVHRDIKPGNIMLTKDADSAGAAAGGREGGQVKVMDFGLAKDVTAPTQLTVSGHIMGTPHYMSPEQCDAKPLDGRSDIYALGATYFAILSGKTPYQGESLLSILQQQVAAPVPDVRKECPDLPEAVQRVLEKAMAKKPEDRFQTMEEFGAALAQIQGAGSGAAPAPAVATQTVKTPVATEAETLAATLNDVMDADEERESHLHTARIRGRIKEVEAFLGTWKELAKAAAASRKKGQASEAEEAEFAKMRNTIHKQYAGILRRLGNPGAPGQRVVSACETGVTLSSIVQMADADFRDLSSHFQTGAKLLFDYVAFLEEGRQDLLRQSTFYFYWDKVMHNSTAAAIAGMAAMMLLSIIGWQVVKHLPKGKLTPRKQVAQQTSTTEDQTSDDAPAEIPAPAKTTATERPALATGPAPSEEADLMALEPAYPGFFPIGVWSIEFNRKAAQADLKGELDRLRGEMRFAKSLGINTTSGNGLYGADGKPYYAMVAKELDLHAICYNSHLTGIYKSKKPVDADAVRKVVGEHARRLKDYPNLFEYWVWYGHPEPHFKPAKWQALAKACTEADPARVPQLAYSFTSNAGAFWKAHPLRSIHSYDYPFSDKDSSARSIQAQIAHLRFYSKLAGDASYFPWLQSFSLGNTYRKPSPTEFRCINSLALAHGAKGLFYGGWRSREGAGKIIDADGRPTELGPEVKRASQIIDRIGPVLLRLRLASDLAQARGNALATTLVSKAGHQYAFVVNLDLEKLAEINVAVTPVAGRTLAGVRDVIHGETVSAQVSAARLTFATRLEPGEGRLFRILHRRDTASPAGAPSASAAEVKLPALIGSHMVLQRDAKVPIWGWATAGGKVTVSFAGQTKTATTDREGKWCVTLDPLPAGGPHQMTVAGSKALTLSDVLVGDVWVCSGQSNMAMPVSAAQNAEAEIGAARFPKIRLFTTTRAAFPDPQTDCEGSWVLCTPETVKTFSAAAYFFGKSLHEALRIPTGLLCSCVGGSKIETWTSRTALMRAPCGRTVVEEYDQKVATYDAQAAKQRYEKALATWNQKRTEWEQNRRGRAPRRPRQPEAPDRSLKAPCSLYNGMVAPLMPFAIRGVAWYQGESDSAVAYEYRDLLPNLISSWREKWGQGDFPFVYVQLPSFTRRGDGSLPTLRESMLKTLRVPNTAMAVTIDIGDPNNVHPKNKQDVGKRLALAARRIAYGENLIHSGPIYKSCQAQGRKLVLAFEHLGSGLTAKGGALTGFTVAGSDRNFVPADATIDDDKVVVRSGKVAKPVAVRYAWADAPECNLYNKDGLPASPFRTDDWPVLGHPDYEEE